MNVVAVAIVLLLGAGLARDGAAVADKGIQAVLEMRADQMPNADQGLYQPWSPADQELVHAVADRIMRGQETPTGREFRGYVGLVVYPDRHSLTLWWTGEVPARILAIQRRVATSVTVTIVLTHTPTRQQLLRAGRALLERTRGSRNPVSAVWGPQDGSGLEVIVGGPQDITADQARRYLQTLTEVPIVSVTFGDVQALLGPTPALARSNVERPSSRSPTAPRDRRRPRGLG